MSVPAQLASAVQTARAVAAQGDLRAAAAMLDEALDAIAAREGIDLTAFHLTLRGITAGAKRLASRLPFCFVG